MSYLSGRKQCVSIAGTQSSLREVTCGVPQGSVLGPLLFIIYLTGLGEVIAQYEVNYVLYADDLQIFVSASTGSLPSTVFRLEKCILAIRSWLASSMLTLNKAKTECLVIGTPPMLSKPRTDR